MVILNDWMAISTECVYYLVLSGLIAYVGKIRSQSFYIGFAIAMPALVVISLTDLLAFVAAYSSLFVALRIRHWRKDVNCRNWEIFVLMLVMLIDLTVMSGWSIMELGLYHPALNEVQNQHQLTLWLFYLSGYLVEIVVALLIQKVLSRIRFTKRELDIVIPQMFFILTSMVFVIEFLRSIKAQGIYELLIFAFLMTQFGYSTQRTISLLRKDKQQAEIAAAKQQLASMSIYTKQLEQSYEQMRKFRHDYKNLLLAVSDEDANTCNHHQYLDALRRYTDKELSRNILRFSDLTRVQVSPLKTLIMTKLTLAQQQGIDIRFECLNSVDNLYSDEITIVRIMGILMDNAIEASSAAADKRMNLLIISNDSNQEIMVENTYRKPLPKLAQMKTVGFSTKGTGRGYGLANLEEIMNQHTELSLTNYIQSGMFGVSLVIMKGA